MVGVAVNWLDAHVLKVLGEDGREWHDAHLPVIGGRGGFDHLKRDKLGMTVGGMMFDSRVGIDGVETEQFPETVCDLYRLVVLGVAWAATSLNGRVGLNVIQATLCANGRGDFAKELVGFADIITG